MKKIIIISSLFLSIISITACKEKEIKLCDSEDYLQRLYPLWSPLYTPPIEEGVLEEPTLFYYFASGFKIKKEDILINPNQYNLDVLFIATKFENESTNLIDDYSITNPFAIKLDIYCEDDPLDNNVTYSVDDFSLEKYKYQEGDFDLCSFSFNSGISVYYPIDIKTFKHNNFQIDITTSFYQYENNQKVIENQFFTAELNYKIENNKIIFSFLDDNSFSIK